MVEVERSHSHSGVGSCCTSDFCDFFLCCFSSSRSSSMKMSSSKSILSPGRGREPPTLSLSSSLSRRLRSNGSMKGGQASPMFATGSGKKKGGSFEPPEPSSPKVTCIGQVRVKSKRRHGRNKLRSNRSQRRGEVSFRKTEQNQDGGNGIHHQQSQQTQQECLRHRNQRWVHLPLSICETLRSFGAEFNCFGPCGGRRSSSSCSWTNEREKSEKRKRTSSSSSSSSNSCGAVFARWLFALEESEEKGKVIETHEEPVIVRNEVEKRVYKEENRGVVEMEITEEKMEIRGRVEEDEVEEEEEEARESICIPPKNALLLMRSRSAPFRMSSLANRFWDSPAPQDKEEDLEEEEDDEFEVHNNGENEEIGEEDRTSEHVEMKSDLEEEEMLESLKEEEEMQEAQSKEDEITEEIKQKEGILRKKISLEDSLEEAMLEMDEREAKMQVEVVEKKEKRRVSFSSSTMYLEPESESELEEDEEVDTILEERSQKSTEEESSVSISEDEKEIPSRSTTTDADQDQDQEDEQISNVKNHEEMEEEEEEKSLLPDCLLLMMCEPKLSMEVSKETWVCSRDFIRFRHSEKKVVPQKTNVVVGDESIKKRLSTDTNPIPKPTQPLKKQQKQQQKSSPAVQIQPARSSCSKVEPLVAAIEKKLTDSRAAYEPFVLKRCKSEPMRNSAKLAPEVCFWNKNKIEANHHHQPPSVGVGATGVGF